MSQRGCQRAGFQPFVDSLVVLAVRPRGRKAEPLAGCTFDSVVLVVLAQQVARDSEQPWRARAVREIAEPARGMPCLRECLSRQIKSRALGPGLTGEP